MSAKKKPYRIIKLPQIPAIPKHPCGHEIDPLEARRLIEEVSQREWGIDWQTFRRRWNHGEFEPKQAQQLRPLARLLQFAVLPPGWGQDAPVDEAQALADTLEALRLKP